MADPKQIAKALPAPLEQAADALIKAGGRTIAALTALQENELDAAKALAREALSEAQRAAKLLDALR